MFDLEQGFLSVRVCDNRCNKEAGSNLVFVCSLKRLFTFGSLYYAWLWYRSISGVGKNDWLEHLASGRIVPGISTLCTRAAQEHSC